MEQASQGGGPRDAMEIVEEDRRPLGMADAWRLQIKAAPRSAGIDGSCRDHCA
jgi:hypothetical protein